MVHVRPLETVEAVLAASRAGVRDRDNATTHGVSLKTVRRWRRDYVRRGLPRGQLHTTARCPRCEGAPLDHAAYAELLGWYLGDGCLTKGRRGVWALHVYEDLRHPGANDRIADLMRAVKPGGRPHRRRLRGCLATTVSWKHWPCLFPQHGPGRKHERDIVLAAWQEQIVTTHPANLLRGLFHSDGCRTINRVRREHPEGERTYAYPRWQFKNTSDDIHAICCAALDAVGVPWTRSGPTTSVSRRRAVDDLDRMIGPKS